MKSNISSDMNKPYWKLAKACPQSQNYSVLEKNNLLAWFNMFEAGYLMLHGHYLYYMYNCVYNFERYWHK